MEFHSSSWRGEMEWRMILGCLVCEGGDVGRWTGENEKKKSQKRPGPKMGCTAISGTRDSSHGMKVCDHEKFRRKKISEIIELNPLCYTRSKNSITLSTIILRWSYRCSCVLFLVTYHLLNDHFSTECITHGRKKN
jgi:hypothetical protein